MNTDRSLKLTAFFRLTAFAAVLLISVNTLTAQPSGGPYGPVRQSWPVPQTGGRIFFVAPDGNYLGKQQAQSLLFTDQTIFMSPELGNYRPLPSFAGKVTVSAVPPEIGALLKLKKKTPPYTGAYPPPI